MLRKFFTVGGANVLMTVLSLARNVAVARLISVEDFGVAATFAILFTLGETLSNMSLDRLIVQAKEGEEPRFQKALHSAQFLRCLVSFVLIALCAAPYAAFMGVPELAWAFQIFATFALMRGLIHFDIHRAERISRFGPMLWTNLIANVASLASVWPLYELFGDWRVMMWAILVQQAVFLIASHFFAERAYRMAVDMAVYKRAIAFGLPLLANAILMFGILNGDRMIVSNLKGVEVLGWFAVAATLALTPSQVISRVNVTVFMPKMAQLQDDDAGFDKVARGCIEFALLSGAALAVGLLLTAAPLVVLLFGEKYAAAAPVLAWLAVAQGVRSARTGPVTAAMARGRTTIPLIANIVRAAFVPAAFLAIYWGQPVVTVAWVAAAGEATSLAYLLYSLYANLRVRRRPLFLPLLGMMAILAVAALDAALHPPTADLLGNLHWGQLGLLAALALYPLLLPEIRGFIGRFLARAAGGGRRRAA